MIRGEIRFLVSEIQRLENTLRMYRDTLDKYTLRSDTGMTLRIKSSKSIEIQKSINRVELSVEEILVLLNWLRDILENGEVGGGRDGVGDREKRVDRQAGD